jgi:plastocyanin
MTDTVSRRRLLAAGGSALVAGTVGGCLGGTSAADGESDLPSEVEVMMTSRPTPKFEPRLVQVAVGGTVRWTHKSGDHDTTAYHPDTYGPERIPPDAEPWTSDTMSTVGESYERTFDTPGVYDYVDTQAVCTAHEQIGNVGSIVVGQPDPDPDAEPGLRPPQEELPSVARGRLEELNEQARRLLSGDATTTEDP